MKKDGEGKEDEKNVGGIVGKWSEIITVVTRDFQTIDKRSLGTFAKILKMFFILIFFVTFCRKENKTIL